MNFTPHHKAFLKSIISGAYTPLDLREFVRLCYMIALPLIRKKVANRKLNLSLLGMTENDVVYDCVADLFQRDEHGKFIKIVSYFEGQETELDRESPDDLFFKLRQLIFAKVANNIIHLYSNADPELGKILRNMKFALEKSDLFDTEEVFGEKCLLPRGVDPLLSCRRMPPEVLTQSLSRVILLYDSLHAMLRKLRQVLVEQDEFQRVVLIVDAAILFKNIYALRWETEDIAASSGEQELQDGEIRQLIDRICANLSEEMRKTYARKRGEELFGKYMLAVKDILLQEFSNEGLDGMSYYDLVKRQIPGLTRTQYASKHRTVMEYLAKTAKKQFREEYKRNNL